jgi:hypothetical protein
MHRQIHRQAIAQRLEHRSQALVGIAFFHVH